jgi:hypothetical protein
LEPCSVRLTARPKASRTCDPSSRQGTSAESSATDSPLLLHAPTASTQHATTKVAPRCVRVRTAAACSTRDRGSTPPSRGPVSPPIPRRPGAGTVGGWAGRNSHAPNSSHVAEAARPAGARPRAVALDTDGCARVGLEDQPSPTVSRSACSSRSADHVLGIRRRGRRGHRDRSGNQLTETPASGGRADDGSR